MACVIRLHTALIKGKWREFHTGSIQILIGSSLCMDPVESAYNIAVHHIDHGLCNGIINHFKGRYTLLNKHITYRHTLFYNSHFVALFAVQVGDFAGIFNGHHTHAIGSSIGLDDDIGFLGNAKGIIFLLNLFQHDGDIIGQTTLTFASLEVNI